MYSTRVVPTSRSSRSLPRRVSLRWLQVAGRQAIYSFWPPCGGIFGHLIVAPKTLKLFEHACTYFNLASKLQNSSHDGCDAGYIHAARGAAKPAAYLVQQKVH